MDYTWFQTVSLRWARSGAQLADCLREVMDSNFLRETLELGKYLVHDELEVLKNRASARNRVRWLKTSCDHPTNVTGCNENCFMCLNTEVLGV